MVCNGRGEEWSGVEALYIYKWDANRQHACVGVSDDVDVDDLP